MSPGPPIIQMVTAVPSALERPCSLRNFPGPVRLQTANEMIVLGINRRATRAHHIFDVLALLVFTTEFLDQLDRARVSGRRIGPGSDSSYGLSVNLIRHSAVDHVEVLLGEDDIRSQVGSNCAWADAVARPTKIANSALTDIDTVDLLWIAS
jgi:hypothetical protein